jgi:hypothetical protein
VFDGPQMTDPSLGEIIVGRTWLFGIATLWCLGVACAAIPVISRWPFRFAMPGPVVAVVLSLIRPGVAGLVVLVVAYALPAVLMMPPLWLIGLTNESNRRPAGLVLLVALAALASSFLLEGYFAPLMIVAIGAAFMLVVPVALVVFWQAYFRAMSWRSGVASASAFACGWIAWVAFNHLNP